MSSASARTAVVATNTVTASGVKRKMPFADRNAHEDRKERRRRKNREAAATSRQRKKVKEEKKEATLKLLEETVLTDQQRIHNLEQEMAAWQLRAMRAEAMVAVFEQRCTAEVASSARLAAAAIVVATSATAPAPSFVHDALTSDASDTADLTSVEEADDSDNSKLHQDDRLDNQAVVMPVASMMQASSGAEEFLSPSAATTPSELSSLSSVSPPPEPHIASLLTLPVNADNVDNMDFYSTSTPAAQDEFSSSSSSLSSASSSSPVGPFDFSGLTSVTHNNHHMHSRTSGHAFLPPAPSPHQFHPVTVAAWDEPMTPLALSRAFSNSSFSASAFVPASSALERSTSGAFFMPMPPSAAASAGFHQHAVPASGSALDQADSTRSDSARDGAVCLFGSDLGAHAAGGASVPLVVGSGCCASCGLSLVLPGISCLCASLGTSSAAADAFD